MDFSEYINKIKEKNTKFIIVAGGVISGVGKGIATASIGRILQKHGYDVTAVKIDPYMNYDAGTLRPTEHGEVFVTEDGGEIDQDLGTYERFLDIDLYKKNNITTGKIYKTIIERERSGGYLGKTVQFIPDVPEEIKKRLYEAAIGHDICVVEIGGTIGDYENIAFLFAAKSIETDLGKDNIVYVLLTYLPIPQHVGEMKSKPTQHAIKSLSETGIFPDIILCRARTPLDEPRKNKIQRYANIKSDYVISAPDVTNIYEIPLNFEKENLGEKILQKLNLKKRKEPNWDKWKKLIKKYDKDVNIAMVGKYVDIGNFTLKDSYVSVNEALKHASVNNNVNLNIHWIDSKQFEKDKSKLKILSDFDGVVVPGGFGSSGVEGKISAIEYVRKNNIPYLGLCFGLQLAVIEYARNVVGLDANTTEVDADIKDPVIDILPEQKEMIKNNKYGATMRLGSYLAVLKKGTKVYDLYKNSTRIDDDFKRIENIDKIGETFRFGKLTINDIRKIKDSVVLERHRHRYEVNPKYIDVLEKNGLVFSGYHERKDNTMLMEFIEIKDHPFFVATQSHPEFKSRPLNPAPLFDGFIKAILNKN